MRTRECLEFGWDTFKRQAGTLVFLTCVLLITQAVIALAAGMVAIRLGGLASVLASGMAWGGFMAVASRAASGKQATLDDAFLPFRQQPTDFLLVGAAAASGVILGPLGGMITGFFTLFAAANVVDGQEFKGALVKSKDVVIAQPWPVIRFMLALLGINVLGGVLFGLGLLVSVPVSALAVIKAREQASAAMGRVVLR